MVLLRNLEQERDELIAAMDGDPVPLLFQYLEDATSPTVQTHLIWAITSLIMNCREDKIYVSIVIANCLNLASSLRKVV